MVGKVSAAVILSCIAAFMLPGIASADGTAGIPTGQIVAAEDGVGSYIDSNGKTRPILDVWLRNMNGSNSKVIYTFKPGEPQIGSKYEMGTPDAVRAAIFLPAHWLVRYHTKVGQPLDYWPELAAVQLSIWGYYNEAILISARVPDATVLARAQELRQAAKEALAKSTPQYFDVHRRIGLSVYVSRSTATKVMIEARLFDLDTNKGLEGYPLDLSYGELESTIKTGKGGTVLKSYPRRDANVVVDVHYNGSYRGAEPWVSINGKEPPIILGEQFPVSFEREIRIDPSTLTSGAALAYQEVSDFMNKDTPLPPAPGAAIGFVVLAGGWLVMGGRMIWNLARRNKEDE